MPHDLPSIPVTPDWEALVRNIRRTGTPRRVHDIELFLDGEVQEAVCQRYDLLADLDPSDPYFLLKRQVRIQRFLGYDYVRCTVEGMEMPLYRANVEDTADLRRRGGRNYQDEHRGPVTTWAEFESYPWPDPKKAGTRALEWYEANLPDDMCVIGSGQFAHFAEHINWLLGYETMCYALYDQPDLVQAIAQRVTENYRGVIAKLLNFSRVKVIWGSDDMGHKTGTLISPRHLRDYVLPGHKLMSEISHAAGRPYLLHSCGNLTTIMNDLVNDVKIDAKHSFEDTIERVEEVKHTYGQHMALLGGIDVDFLCRASEEQIRARVRKTLEVCMPGGGYCLGTGNSVTNYIPFENYLVMLDEGRKFCA